MKMVNNYWEGEHLAGDKEWGYIYKRVGKDWAQIQEECLLEDQEV